MDGVEGTHALQWSLGPLFGSNNPLFALNPETIIFTWVVIGLLAILCFPIRWILKKNTSVPCYLAVSGVQFFVSSIRDTLPYFSFAHFSFIATVFIFIFGCNVVSMIPGITPNMPWFEEPTTDLNTTIALGLISFFYTQTANIRTRGLWAYGKSYFSPFFVMFPLNVIGKLASVISLSFRLFGNIFGGSIISGLHFSTMESSVIYQTLGLITGFNLVLKLFFGLFEGYLQAFVFTMLTLTYLSIALQKDDGGH